jgi:plasmid maintenance system antidote protein VapI
MTHAQAAKALGITQPRLNALLKGRIGLFSLDALVNIASRAGLNGRKEGRVSTMAARREARSARALSHLSSSGTPHRKSAAHTTR